MPDLPELRVLNLTTNLVVDARPLEKYGKIQQLYLSNNFIKEVDFIPKIADLKKMSLFGNYLLENGGS